MAISATMRRLVALGALVASAGCMAKTLSSGAETVRMVHATPKGCERLGDVSGHQGNVLTGDFTSQKDLEDGARSDLINHAYKLGGNAVQIVGREGNGADAWAGEAAPRAVTYSGVAWRCPEASLSRGR
jgi:hypothetical protein